MRDNYFVDLFGKEDELKRWARAVDLYVFSHWMGDKISVRDFANEIKVSKSAFYDALSKRSVIEYAYLGGYTEPVAAMLEHLKKLADKNNTHILKLLFIFESCRAGVKRREFCEAYGLNYNTTRPYISADKIGHLFLNSRQLCYGTTRTERPVLFNEDGKAARLYGMFRERWAEELDKHEVKKRELKGRSNKDWLFNEQADLFKPLW